MISGNNPSSDEILVSKELNIDQKFCYYYCSLHGTMPRIEITGFNEIQVDCYKCERGISHKTFKLDDYFNQIKARGKRLPECYYKKEHGKRNGVYYCPDPACQKYFCQNCLIKYHSNLKDHFTYPSDGLIVQTKDICVNKATILWYCKTCHEHLCQSCADNKHKNKKHDLVKLFKLTTDEMEAYRKEFDEGEKKLKDIFPQILDNVSGEYEKRIKTERDLFTSNADRIKGIFETFCSLYVDTQGALDYNIVNNVIINKDFYKKALKNILQIKYHQESEILKKKHQQNHENFILADYDIQNDVPEDFDHLPRNIISDLIAEGIEIEDFDLEIDGKRVPSTKVFPPEYRGYHHVVIIFKKNITKMFHTFDLCCSLVELDLSNFKAPNLESLDGAFARCSILKSINLQGFKTDKVKDMICTFYGCESLTSINLNSFRYDNLTEFYGMFQGCKSLKEIDLSNLKYKKTNDQKKYFMDKLLEGCENLEKIKLPRAFKIKKDDFEKFFHCCGKLNYLKENNTEYLKE